MPKASKLEELFLSAWNEHGYPESDITAEYKLGRYRYDFAFPRAKVFVELQGFGFGHQSVAKVARDCAKARTAAADGWLMLPFSSRCLGSKASREDAIHFVMAIVEHRMTNQEINILSDPDCNWEIF